MKLLIIDTETTGTTEDSQCCEIAVTLYQVGKTSRETGALISVSTLLEVKENSAESLNGIAPELTSGLPNSQIYAHPLNVLSDLIDIADYCIAFNAEFDKSVVSRHLFYRQPEAINWLCAMKDFDWGYPNETKYGTFKLTDLALWMGIGVSFAHRAGDDVRLLVECLNRKKAELPAMIEKAIVRANSPLITLKALVDFDNKQLAKDAGFEWKGKPDGWQKIIKECDKEELLSAVNFECEAVNNAT